MIDAATRTIEIVVVNTGDEPADVTISPLAYGGTARTLRLAAGETTRVPWRAATGWYDLWITVAGDAGDAGDAGGRRGHRLRPPPDGTHRERRARHHGLTAPGMAGVEGSGEKCRCVLVDRGHGCERG
ncbi:phospholipase domain-containing protein [Streptosporangium vulgare]|uniref:phospholipase domain-containing protein n=1 Tax=Streptosporangium vulgare TaxID=46190 RepID=UPI0031D1E6D9